MSNKYTCSDGTKLLKSVIDRRIREAKATVLQNQIHDYGYNHCEVCKKSGGVYLDCSHTISVDECQKSGRAELAFDVTNYRVLCRKCHQKHDKLY